MSVSGFWNPNDIQDAGWGLVLPADTGPELRDALRPLIDRRRAEAGERYRNLEYRPDESAAGFLARHGMGFGPANPDRVPYYILLVGGPDTVPQEFQSQLDIQYAVGRVAFDSPDGYRHYAERVLRAEDAGSPVDRVDLVAPGSANDHPSQLTIHWLMEPLASALREKGMRVETSLGSNATKARLKGLLTRVGAPGLLVFAGHGLGFPYGDPRQAADQGALLCADWPGLVGWSGPVSREHYLSGDDLADTACPGASIAVLYASYSAASPKHDSFARQLFREQIPIAPRPLVARLAQHLLGSPGDGPLAVIGMADRVWGWALNGVRSQGPTALIRSLLLKLLEGQRIGAAMEVIAERYAERASALSTELEEREFGKESDNQWLVDIWTAANDARAMILLGDPAVRLAPRATQSVA